MLLVLLLVRIRDFSGTTCGESLATGGMMLIPGGAATKVLRHGCSFAGLTLVLMADGSYKPISQIRVGDLVLATDPLTRGQSPRRVTHVWVHLDSVVQLNVGGEWLTTTEDHPFWDQLAGKWKRADKLGRGALVGTADGYLASVHASKLRSRRIATYNLTVEGVHTYHVGRAGILVHNSKGCTQTEGEVVFNPPEGATDAEKAQVAEYVEVCNAALAAGCLSPSGRVSTSGSLSRRARNEARKEGRRAERAGTPYQGVVGHGPDSTWTGTAKAFKWLDLTSLVNSSLAGQVNRYPVGFKSTGFRCDGC